MAATAASTDTVATADAWLQPECSCRAAAAAVMCADAVASPAAASPAAAGASGSVAAATGSVVGGLVPQPSPYCGHSGAPLQATRGLAKNIQRRRLGGALCPIPEPFAATIIGLSTTRLPVCGEHRLP